LITCVQLDIFRQLTQGPQDAAGLAGQTGADPRALRRLLDAAVAMNLLTKENGVYAKSLTEMKHTLFINVKEEKCEE
ncbi:MAG TPA: methyltransferase dimerization domain-containing protein, partial [Anaerolineae bacterium]